MRNRVTKVLICTTLALTVFEALAADIRIESARARETAPGQVVGAGYMTIVNDGSRADRLLGAKSAIAEEVQMHDMSTHEGIMRMRSLDEGIIIPPHGRVELKSGGAHLMLLRLKGPLESGKKIPITLQFERNGTIDALFSVEPIAR